MYFQDKCLCRDYVTEIVSEDDNLCEFNSEGQPRGANSSLAVFSSGPGWFSSIMIIHQY